MDMFKEYGITKEEVFNIIQEVKAEIETESKEKIKTLELMEGINDLESLLYILLKEYVK